jgi:hypothetical protein
MCCCGKPVVNGEVGYRWQPNDAPGVRGVNPPELLDNEELLHDEPGRCGGLDSHCHHYRIVKHFYSHYLVVRHGGGDERFRLCTTPLFLESLNALDSNSRYWMLNALFCAGSDGERKGRETANARWKNAAAEKRIKTRKLPSQGIVKVWIEPKVEQKGGA